MRFIYTKFTSRCSFDFSPESHSCPFPDPESQDLTAAEHWDPNLEQVLVESPPTDSAHSVDVVEIHLPVVNVNSVSKISQYFNSRLKLKLTPNTPDDAVVSREKVKRFKTWLVRG